MRFAVAFWIIEALLVALIVALSMRLYRVFRGRPFKPANFVPWVALAVAIVVVLNLTSHR